MVKCYCGCIRNCCPHAHPRTSLYSPLGTLWVTELGTPAVWAQSLRLTVHCAAPCHRHCDSTGEASRREEGPSWRDGGCAGLVKENLGGGAEVEVGVSSCPWCSDPQIYLVHMVLYLYTLSLEGSPCRNRPLHHFWGSPGIQWRRGSSASLPLRGGLSASQVCAPAPLAHTSWLWLP